MERTLTFAIQVLMRRCEDIRDAFHRAVYDDRDVDVAMTVAGSDCTLEHAPVGTGAGPDGLRAFLADDVVAHLPAGLAFQRVTRTLDQRRVVEETLVSFTHDRPLPWLLPGIPATGRDVEVRAVSIAAFRHTTHLGDISTRITSYRVLWDLYSMLTQLDVDPARLRHADRVPG
ncbi:dienelactone hydrolase family [Pseudonocardia sp. N23]|nr:dienelactone hydrolase family [Pseudonocardia sp. N23]